MTELQGLLASPVEFGVFLRFAREARKMTQHDLAKACGLNAVPLVLPAMV